MYVGARHASVNVQPKHLSLLHGIKSKSIVMVDGLKGHYRIAYEKSKWAGQPVFLPLKRREIDKVENSTSKELSPYNSDYDGAILLPRVTEVFF
jgi:hypothetical protein